MPATLTRAATTVHPDLVRPSRLTRPTRSVVHTIIGDTEPDITSREPGLRTGDLQLIFATPAAAAGAAAAFAAVGGPWTIVGTPDVDGTWKVTGDLVYEPAGEGLRSRLVTVGVQEVGA